MLRRSDKPRSIAATVERARELGCAVTVTTTTRVTKVKVGEHRMTLADKLRIENIDRLDDAAREEVGELLAVLKRDRPQALAAVSVTAPPVPWLRVLVDRFRSGERVHGRRVTLDALTANVCGFVGVDPLDGAAFSVMSRTIDDALNRKRSSPRITRAGTREGRGREVERADKPVPSSATRRSRPGGRRQIGHGT